MSCFRGSKSSRRGDAPPTVRRTRRDSASTSSVTSEPTTSLTPTPRRIISVADVGSQHHDRWQQNCREARNRRTELSRGSTSSTTSTTSRPSNQATPTHKLAQVRTRPILPFERGGSLPDDPGDQRRRQAASISEPPTTAGLQDSQTLNPPRLSGFDLPNASGPPSDQTLLDRLPSSPQSRPENLTMAAPGPGRSVLARELAESSASAAAAHSPRTKQRLAEQGSRSLMSADAPGIPAPSSSDRSQSALTEGLLRPGISQRLNTIPPRQTSSRSQDPSEGHDPTTSRQPLARAASSEHGVPTIPEGLGLGKLSVKVSTSPRHDPAARAGTTATGSPPKSQRPLRPTEATSGRTVPSRSREQGAAAAWASAENYRVTSESVANSPAMGAARALQGLQYASSRGSPSSRFSPSRFSASPRLGRTASDASSRQGSSPSAASQPPHLPKAESSKKGRAAQLGASALQSPRAAAQPRLEPRLTRGGSSTSPLPQQANALTSLGIGDRTMRIRVEAEILIADKNETVRGKVDRFVVGFADKFNADLGLEASKMPNTLRSSDFVGDFDRWYWKQVTADRGDYSPFQIRLCSPMFEPASNPNWRREIETTWSFLKERYRMRGSSTTHTCIYFSLKSSLQTAELKKVAQAALHFNSALEAVVPNTTVDPNMKTIWLDNPSTPIGQRTTSIGVDILGAVRDTVSRTELVKQIQPVTDTNYNWNFVTLLTSEDKEIEFRRPPASKTSQEVLGWAELTLAFCLAALRSGSTAELKGQLNSALGLKIFLERADVEGVTESERMRNLWVR